MQPHVSGIHRVAAHALSQSLTWFASHALLGQCIVAALALDVAETPGVPHGSGDVCARVRAELHRAVEDRRIAGGVHLVVRDGKTLYSEAAGFGDIEDRTPFTVDSILRIYSMTKPITSVAAMMLFEQGKFGLDDPVAQFIPAFTNATVLEPVDGIPRQVPPKRPITVRDVFRHTSGYGYGDEPSVHEFYEREGLRYWGPQGVFPPRMTIAQAADALARVPALHHPGEKYTYGFNTDLLGRLIEIWSGDPLDLYLQRAVFEPLEMVDTGFSVPWEKRARFTSCHTFSDGKLAVLDPADSSPYNNGFEFLSGGGGLVSTVRDYANFCQMLVDGGWFKGRCLLKPETLRLMFTDQLNGVDGTHRFGLGFGIDRVELGSGTGKRQATGYHWGGYASTHFAVVPEEKLFQIFALQQLPYTEELARQQFAIVYAGLAPRSIPKAASAGDTFELLHTNTLADDDLYQTNANILYLTGGDRILITGDREKELLGRYKESAYLWRMFQVVGHPDAGLIELEGYDHGQMAEPAYPLLLRFIEQHRPASTDSTAGSSYWNQFRGPNGQGVAPAAEVPLHFGPETNALWKLTVPPGHSSPVI